MTYRETDLTVVDALRGAVSEAEERSRRTLRKSVTSTAYFCRWERVFKFPYPILQSITTLKYYDVNNTLQTVSSSDYRALASSRKAGLLEIDHSYSFPSLYDRLDPIQVVFVRGYGTADMVPGAAKVAIRLLAEANFDTANAQELREGAHKILGTLTFRG